MTTTATVPCSEPGCPGTIEDGYCNVCGSPAGGSGTAPTGTVTGASATGAPAPGSAAAASPSAMLGTGFVEGRPGTAPGSADPDGERSTRTGRTSSSRLASTALGSARTAATGSKATRRVGTSSTRLRGRGLGAGLTTVPSVPVRDPLQSVMAVPEVAERKRFCPACGEKVGRGRDGQPGRTSGFCPHCGTRFDFTPQLKPGDLVGGQYEVVGCLAHGGLGWIYLARDQNVSGRWVVLKGLLNSGDPDAYAAAISERQFLAEVEHPLIVEIYNFAMHDGAGYTVMEYVGGESLKEILQARREANNGVIDPMPVDQALAYVLAILPAFAYLHDHNLLFCDFKPENVIQQGDGVKLIDLGGVRRADDMTSAIFGTVGYQAPEVAEVGPSVASDIYTIGRTLATLVLDFRGNTTTYVASLPPVADTPVFQQYDSFYRLLAKACALDPADRFATADEMRTQLLGVLREVVAADAGPGNPALHSAASVLFEAPVADVAGRPLAWDELPSLRRDDHDPMASWLAGVNVVDPDARLAALADAPEDTVEVRLARARAAIEAERFDVLRDTIARILADDPWEWRAAWLGGLGELAQGDAVAARASFNAVYGQVPGELAPKLALAAACELSGEPDIAESLYVICARTDANYTAPAAFGLMRIREARGDLDGALHALDLVGPTRGSYVESRTLRAHLLAESGRGLPALADAMASVAAVSIAPRERAELAVGVLRSALETVTTSGPEPTTRIAGVPADEPALRDALEGAYRELASLTDSRDERIVLVDRANEVRRWTVR
ncbi:serine/threonine-protein kinase [Cellulosimicrobium composti]|uniref:non-specific serine/threonine protein kinase n=1 Tax=Cellulosimicrobium composti TaxID=2672572 RepID=A0ABX0BHE7_9MICO|nr:serine/threonine-protein kinase [Cellulosimicrobium composti]NDO91070.1 protein kinase [Cellulosimicrobium composti]TWG81031.1 serine/threonine-protein kinase PknG [Cellulosimicrobium cellulans J34]SMF49271.1 serine/threonine-protein kinase PknG [Cellulosimicrobium cellulans J1]